MKNRIQLLVLIFIFISFQAAFGQVRINEVGTNGVAFQGAQKWVELYNAGTDAVDVGTLIFCDFPQYPEVRSLSVLAGDLTIPAGGFLVVAWPSLDMNNSNDAEIGLYESGTFDFNDPTKVLDYMQWGNASHTRAGAAVSAGVWVANEFVAAPSAGESLQFIDNGAPGSGNWVLGAPSPNGENVLLTSIEDAARVPGDFTLIGNYPNPFNPSTTIMYELNKPGYIALTIYNVLGQRVITLFEGQQGLGTFELAWDGKNARGELMTSGVYFYRLNVDGTPGASRIMTLLK